MLHDQARRRGIHEHDYEHGHGHADEEGGADEAEADGVDQVFTRSSVVPGATFLRPLKASYTAKTRRGPCAFPDADSLAAVA